MNSTLENAKVPRFFKITLLDGNVVTKSDIYDKTKNKLWALYILMFWVLKVFGHQNRDFVLVHESESFTQN